jgi:hypothetical protein
MQEKQKKELFSQFYEQHLKAKYEKAPRYTLEEIAAHNTEQDCWVILNGKVYDVSKCASARNRRASCRLSRSLASPARPPRREEGHPGVRGARCVGGVQLAAQRKRAHKGAPDERSSDCSALTPLSSLHVQYLPADAHLGAVGASSKL